MMEKTLSEMLKKYVDIFINEYSEYLSTYQLEVLKQINYEKIISIEENSNPFGLISLGRISLSNVSYDLINNIKNMDGYNTTRYNLNNKNLSSYLKYMCDNGYNLLEYYGDILMYFVFKLVIRNDSFFINGLVNQEMKYLSIKYSIRLANLYAREEAIVSKITPIFKLDTIKRIIFMDKPTCFKYLNDNFGFRYANLVFNISNLVDSKYKKMLDNDYSGFEGFLDYTEKYDHISYGDVYNYLLDFEVENKIYI